MTLSELAITYLHCPFCEAEPGERCHTITDHRPYPRTIVHGDRDLPLRLAWGQGWNSALEHYPARRP